MAAVNHSFTAVEAGPGIQVRAGEQITADLSGTFSATLVVERTFDGGQTYETVATYTDTANATFTNDTSDAGVYRFRCDAYTSGTAVTSLTDVSEVLKEFFDQDGAAVMQIVEGGVTFPLAVNRSARKYVYNGGWKAGSAAGWVVAAGDDRLLATLPANQTASKLIVPIASPRVEDVIKAFFVQGRIESAGSTVTLDAKLVCHQIGTAAILDVTKGTMSQISATADTSVNEANSRTTPTADQTIAIDKAYFIEITATTGADGGVEIMGIGVEFDEA
jgi:hypothetical protein